MCPLCHVISNGVALCTLQAAKELFTIAAKAWWQGLSAVHCQLESLLEAQMLIIQIAIYCIYNAYN